VVDRWLAWRGPRPFTFVVGFTLTLVEEARVLSLSLATVVALREAVALFATFATRPVSCLAALALIHTRLLLRIVRSILCELGFGLSMLARLLKDRMSIESATDVILRSLMSRLREVGLSRTPRLRYPGRSTGLSHTSARSSRLT